MVLEVSEPLLDIDIADCRLGPSVAVYVAAFKMEQEVKHIVALNKFLQDIFLPFLSSNVTFTLLVFFVK